MPELINPRGRLVKVALHQVDKLLSNGWSVPKDTQNSDYNPLYDGVISKDGPKLSPVQKSKLSYLEVLKI